MPELVAARTILPFWTGWSNLLLYLSVALLATTVVFWLAVRILRFRTGPEAHWSELARQVFRVRVAFMVCSLLMMAEFAIFSTSFVGAFSVISWKAFVSLMCLCIWLLGLYMAWRQNRRWHGSWLRFGYWLRGRLTYLLVFMPAFPVALIMALLLPGELGPGFWVIGVFGLGLMLITSLGGGLAIAHRVGLAGPAPEHLHHLLQRAAAEAGVELRGSYLLHTPMANAVALPVNGVIAFTDRALEVLDEDEILAIAHHEAGHLAESWKATAGRMQGMALLLVIAFWRPLYHYQGMWGVVLGFVVAILFSFRAVRSVRRHEDAADAHAHGTAGQDEGVYARALEKIHRDNLIPAVLPGKRHTHPNLYDRMESAGVRPDFPRPDPPPKRRLAMLAVLVMAVVVLIVALTPMMVLAKDSGRRVMAGLFVTGGNAWQLSAIATQRRPSQPEQARILLEAAVALDTWPDFRLQLAEVLVVLGRRQDAVAQLRKAEQVYGDHFEPHDHIASRLAEVRRLLEK